MAHESFEDDDTAALMNELVVNVKVDREERPDVDAIYMDAVQAMTGQGGWPMTVFLMPDGRPFFGGTYFPKVGRRQHAQLHRPAAPHRRRVAHPARRPGRAGRRAHRVDQPGRPAARPATTSPAPTCSTAPTPRLAGQFDPSWGGFGRAPKFPQTMSLELLLRAHAHNGSPETLAMVTTSLDAMASGGIYDHLGGGFARYSVDEQWLVPHFEKMLYDQALLARVYLHAWQVTGEARYRQVLDETIDYVLRDLRHRGGGFYSAEDADSLDPDGHPRRAGSTPGPATSSTRCSAPLADGRGRVVGRHRRRQLRGPQHPAPAGAGRPGPARRRSSGPAASCSTSARAGPGPGSTTRCSPSGTG